MRQSASRSSTMPRPASVQLAALTWFLVLAPRPAARPQPVPRRGPVPPCASGPGGLIGCIPSPGDLLSGAARTAGGGVMKVFTVFFTDGANWFLERLEELVTAPTRPDLSVGWWVQKYNLMLALAAVVAAATLILALIDDAAKGSPEGLARAVLADVPVAGLVGGIGPLVIQYLVDLADWLNGRLLRAVITNAATDTPNVVGLVYVAAFAPDEAEVLGDVAASSKDSLLGTAQIQRGYPTGGGGETAPEFLVDPARFREVFAADLPAEQAAVLAATQRPVAAAAFSDVSGPPAWKTLPS